MARGRHLTAAEAAGLRQLTQFTLLDHSQEVLAQLDKAEEKVLEMIGILVEGDAVERCPIDTGNLMLSITHERQGKWEVIGSPVEYAPDVELGTSKSKAQPYLRPAVEENWDVIKKIVKDNLG